MNTVLVTGGTGFIGSHLVEALVKEGTTVRVLDDLSTGFLEYLAGVRSQIEFIRGDVADMAVERFLQYEPQISFEEGLAKTIEWFHQHLVSPSFPTA